MTRAEIIGSDSRQIYKYLNIGTATPTEDELKQAPHHFINYIAPDEYYSAGVFGKEAEARAMEIIERGALCVVVGGSGLYIKALCEGFFESGKVETKESVRIKLKERLNESGNDALYAELQKVDLAAAEKYSDKNPRRVLRALEHYYSVGEPISKSWGETPEKPFETLYFAVDRPREELYERINRRSEIMWKSGLIDETIDALNKGYSRDLNALNTVGYKETIEYLDGKISAERAVELIQRNTRRYAKRQLTWFRGNEKINWIAGSPQKIAREIFNIYSKK